MVQIKEVKDNKKSYLDLLLLADEQEDMMDHYLPQGIMYILYDKDAMGECVVLEEDDILEIKNIAIYPQYQGYGYGKMLIDFLVNTYKNQYTYIQVGTGESPLTIPFYQKCGFEYSHRIKNFFTDYYDHPIYEDGIQLRDMVYFKRKL